MEKEKAMEEIKKLSPSLYSLIVEETGDEFKYRMLARFQLDCEYYLNWGGRNPKTLWAGDELKHVRLMGLLYNVLPEAPQWINQEEINRYRKEMCPGKKYVDSQKVERRKKWEIKR